MGRRKRDRFAEAMAGAEAGMRHTEEAMVVARRPARQVDWRRVAQLLAEGHSTIHVATVMNCSRQTVWRILRRSQSLRARTSELRRHEMAETGARLFGLREMVVETIHQALLDGDKRTARWLADRLGLHRFGFVEALAAEATAGGDQLESETVLAEAAATTVPADAAASAIEIVEAEVTVAENEVAATSQSAQGVDPVTDATRNGLKHPFQIVTTQGVWPPNGVYADG
jgi:hypothetical protein